MTRTAPLAVGDPAPPFSLIAADGRTVSLSAFHERIVVLYFYPKDDTPGCTKEACDFRDQQGALTKAGAAVLGVSGDATASHQKFTKKFGLTFPLLSDPGFAVSSAYGVYKRKLLYGRSFLGLERTTFVIDGRGRIAAIFPKVKVDGHAAAVLDAVRAAARPAPIS